MDSKFYDMCKVFRDSPALSATQTRPRHSVRDHQAVKDRVIAARARMPEEYRDRYADVLLRSIDCGRYAHALDRELAASGEPAVGKVGDAVIGAITDWADDPAAVEQLRRFLRVTTEFYRGRGGAGATKDPGNPAPLVTFAPTLNWGPHTLNPKRSADVTGASIAVVSLPDAYRDQPLLWTALAHEVAGHDLMHAKDDVVAALKRVFATDRTLQVELRGWHAIWDHFMEEVTADVCAVLAMGPAFAISLLATLSAAPRTDHPVPRLGAVRTFYRRRSGVVLDQHPPDLLRIYGAIGVVEVLGGLDPATREQWLALLVEVAAVASGGATTIDVYNEAGLAAQMRLSTLTEVARLASRRIASTRLAVLHDRALCDLDTWSQHDEAKVGELAHAAATGNALTGTVPQLLAGATMALYERRASYDAITAALCHAL